MKYRCAYCRKRCDKWAGHVNRARAQGLNLYCDRRCSGLGRRIGKTKAQRKAEKRLYDIEYRAKNLAHILARKKDYHKRTYDPMKAAAHRQTRMPCHVEYCRRPEYKKWKKEYDRKYLAKKHYGPFAEAALALTDLNTELKQRTDKHETKYQNGATNKAQRRRRQGAQGTERGRNSRRSADHSATYG